MGFFSGLCSIVSSAVGLVAAILSPVLAPVIATLAPVLSAVSPIINVIAPMLEGLIEIHKPFGDKSIEEIGERVLHFNQSMESFDCFDDYRRYISESPLEHTKSMFSLEERLIAGLAFGVRCLEEDLGVSFNKETLEIFGVHSDFFTKERVCAYVHALRQNQLEMNMLSKYFDERLPTTLELQVEAILVSCERNLSPEFSDAEHLTRLREIGIS